MYSQLNAVFKKSLWTYSSCQGKEKQHHKFLYMLSELI